MEVMLVARRVTGIGIRVYVRTHNPKFGRRFASRWCAARCSLTRKINTGERLALVRIRQARRIRREKMPSLSIEERRRHRLGVRYYLLLSDIRVFRTETRFSSVISQVRGRLGEQKNPGGKIRRRHPID